MDEYLGNRKTEIFIAFYLKSLSKNNNKNIQQDFVEQQDNKRASALLLYSYI